MKLTDDRVKEMLKDNIVVVRRGAVSIGLSKDCYDNVVHNLGALAEKDWQMTAVLKDEEATQ